MRPTRSSGAAKASPDGASPSRAEERAKRLEIIDRHRAEKVALRTANVMSSRLKLEHVADVAFDFPLMGALGTAALRDRGSFVQAS